MCGVLSLQLVVASAGLLLIAFTVNLPLAIYLVNLFCAPKTLNSTACVSLGESRTDLEN